jgi:hypothetical protein
VEKDVEGNVADCFIRPREISVKGNRKKCCSPQSVEEKVEEFERNKNKAMRTENRGVETISPILYIISCFIPDQKNIIFWLPLYLSACCSVVG